jgi:hypothetical protein
MWPRPPRHASNSPMVLEECMASQDNAVASQMLELPGQLLDSLLFYQQ